MTRSGSDPGGTGFAFNSVRELLKSFHAASGEHRSMTVRLTTTPDGMTIRVEGHLTRADVADLRAACESANAPWSLDLSGLRSADTDGIRALQSLLKSGAESYGANPYVRELLSRADR